MTQPVASHQETFDTSTIFVSGALYYGYRYMSPQLGRWVSRDPSEEDGGINIFSFNVNTPVNVFDGLGLWGVLQRIEQPTAQICSTSPSDTWVGLAKIAEMAPSQYSKWVHEVSGTAGGSTGSGTVGAAPVLGRLYEVPNTMYLAAPSANFNVVFTPYEVAWKAKGFKVVYNTSVSAILKSQDTYGFMFFGHGLSAHNTAGTVVPVGAIKAADGNFLPDTSVSIAPVDLAMFTKVSSIQHHAHALIWIVGCNSASGKWESHVSINGLAVLYNYELSLSALEMMFPSLIVIPTPTNFKPGTVN